VFNDLPDGPKALLILGGSVLVTLVGCAIIAPGRVDNYNLVFPPDNAWDSFVSGLVVCAFFGLLSAVPTFIAQFFRLGPGWLRRGAVGARSVRLAWDMDRPLRQWGFKSVAFGYWVGTVVGLFLIYSSAAG